MTSAQELVHADTSRRGCLTANIYVQLPTENGGVRIGNHTGAFLDSPGSYLFGEGEIPDDTPSVLLVPAAGELVVWNPTCPHVVYPFSGGSRVSMQTWLKVVPSAQRETLCVELLN
ncbi:MAG: 2OG-Fe(II) oxygenase [Gemmatimonadetes bacterium]|nr:2OG-Fe(II) oxygenase [Gemmatimonadota bacterium]